MDFPASHSLDFSSHSVQVRFSRITPLARNTPSFAEESFQQNSAREIRAIRWTSRSFRRMLPRMERTCNCTANPGTCGEVADMAETESAEPQRIVGRSPGEKSVCPGQRAGVGPISEFSPRISASSEGFVAGSLHVKSSQTYAAGCPSTRG